MKKFLSGGFLRGYRTYLFGLLAALTVLIQWATGDLSTAELARLLPEVFGGFGLMALRSAIGRLEEDVSDEESLVAIQEVLAVLEEEGHRLTMSAQDVLDMLRDDPETGQR
ncbi:MAG: hypothetical protein U1E83_01225 [Methylotetracoccus sp.]